MHTVHLETGRHPARITEQEVARFRDMARALLDSPEPIWQQAVGKLLSDSSVIVENTAGQPVFVSDLLANDWMRHPDSRLLYHLGEDRINLFYNGRSHRLPRDTKTEQMVQQICDHRDWPKSLVRQCVDDPAMEALILELATNNAIVPGEK